LLQPISLLIKSGDIDKTVELLFLKEAKAIVSVCEVNQKDVCVIVGYS